MESHKLKNNNLHCSLTVIDSQLAIAALGGNIKDPENISEMFSCWAFSKKKSYKVGVTGKTMRIQDFQYLEWSQNCVYHTHSWQMTWRESPGRRSLLSACLRCKVNVDWGEDIQLAWAHVLIIAQVSPTSTCYFSSKNFYFSWAHFSDNNVDYDIIMRNKKKVKKEKKIKYTSVVFFTAIRWFHWH